MIPTAEEFLLKSIDYAEYNRFLQKKIEKTMIEFAKLHVKAAIKACIEEAPSGSSSDPVSYEDVVEALKDCYPKENIK